MTAGSVLRRLGLENGFTNGGGSAEVGPIGHDIGRPWIDLLVVEILQNPGFTMACQHRSTGPGEKKLDFVA
ncbi:MAG: hypothetical protein AAF191_17445 [Verrucomicrobiota bacterium]